MKSNNNLPIFQPNKTRDITGEKFNSLTAIEFSYRDEKHRHYWKFKCECENEIILRKSSVTSGNTRMCKECSIKSKALKATTHGLSKTRLYREWANMISRCENSLSTAYNRYGAVGISVCEEWHEFECFNDWSLNNGYNDNLTIDRISNNKGYSPSNCRWATMLEQANNKSTNVYITHKEETHTLSEWARIYNMNKYCLYERHKKSSNPKYLFRGYERSVV